MRATPLVARAITIFVLPGAGCAGRAIAPAPLEVRAAPAPTSRPCESTAEAPPLPPLFLPHTGGELALIAAVGEPRLSALGRSAITWSADDSLLVFADQSAITVWRGSDGAPLERHACARSFRANEVALSPDERWIVASGLVDDGPTEAALTCVVDRTTGAVTRAPGVGLADMGFEGPGAIVHSHGRSFDLVSGRVDGEPWAVESRLLPGGDRLLVFVPGLEGRRAEVVDRASKKVMHRFPSAPSIRMSASGDGRWLAILAGRGADLYEVATGALARHLEELDGAEMIALSHDGRRLAGWTLMRMILFGGGEGAAPPPADPRFTAVWDAETGRRLWRNDTRCCDRWAFSRDGTFLEAPPGRWAEEKIRVETGEIVSFPGEPSRVSPSGRHFLVHGPRGPELWSVEPTAPLLVPPRSRAVIARSPDGSLAATTERRADHRDALFLEGHGRCVDLGADGVSEVAFTPDGHHLLAAVSSPNASFHVWRTDTAELVRSFTANGPRDVYLMPAARRVGLAVEGGIRLFDALRGDALLVAEAPRIRYVPTGRHAAEVWEVRARGGRRPDALLGRASASADGRYLVGHAVRGVSVWDLHDRRATLDLPVPAAAGPLALSPDERFIAAGLGDGSVALWTRAGVRLPVAARHGGAVERIAFSPDGSRLASAGGDGRVRVIDTASGRVAGDVELAADRASGLWWSPDGKRLVIDTERRFTVTVSRLPAVASRGVTPAR